MSRAEAAALALDGNATVDRLLGEGYLLETLGMLMLSANGVEATVGFDRL